MHCNDKKKTHSKLKLIHGFSLILLPDFSSFLSADLGTGMKLNEKLLFLFILVHIFNLIVFLRI